MRPVSITVTPEALPAMILLSRASLLQHQSTFIRDPLYHKEAVEYVHHELMELSKIYDIRKYSDEESVYFKIVSQMDTALIELDTTSEAIYLDMFDEAVDCLKDYIETLINVVNDNY